MGTSNFAYRDRLFAVSLNCDCAKCAEEEDEVYHGCDCSSSYYDDLLDNIRSTMNGMAKKTKNKITVTFDAYPASHEEYTNDNHNYGGRILGRIIATSDFFGQEIKLVKRVIVRSGYYDGANIDHDLEMSSEHTYEFKIAKDDDFKQCVESVIEDFVWQETMTKAQGAQHLKNMIKRFEAMQTALDDAFEYIATQNATEYEVSARFSNGETWYKPKEVKLAA